jgi:nitroreductase
VSRRAVGLSRLPPDRHRARRQHVWTIDRDLGLPQWADAGMYLQTVMLLLRAEGLHSCPQMSWAKVHKTVAQVLSRPDELILYCGMSIGYEDVTVSYTRTGRAPLDETVTFCS